MATIEIEWCFIGKRNLDRAIALYRKVYPGGRSDTITIKWRPYYLSYNPHPYSVDKAELVDERLADMSPDQRTALFNKMYRIGQSVGIHFKGGGKIGSTRDAHRLVHLLSLAGSEHTDPVVEKIFEAYHERGMDISDKNVLKELAVETGLGEEKMREWLEGDEGTEEVDKQAHKNKEVLKSGVPVYTVQGAHQIDGSGDPGEFLEALSNAKGEPVG